MRSGRQWLELFGWVLLVGAVMVSGAAVLGVLL